MTLKLKTSKVFITLLVVFSIFISAFAIGATLQARAADLESGVGSCGDNVTYSFDADTGVLTISGTGPMWDWTIVAGETHFSNSPFVNKYNIKSVVMEEGVTTVGAYALYGCKYITSVQLPESIKSIGDYAFYGCTTLKNITIPSGVTSIGTSSFYYCMNITSITIPNGVTIISDYAFYNCTRLENITLSPNITSIGSYAFFECKALSRIVLPDSIEKIEYGAFRSCTALTSMSFPNSAKFYNGTSTFYEDTNITDLTITAGNGSVNNYSSSSSDSNENYYQYTPWYTSRNSLQSITIADGVTGIGNRIFFGINNIEHIAFPESVSSFGTEIFDKSNCNLKSATVHNSSADIGIERLVSVMPLGSTLYAYESTGAEAICNNYGVKFISLNNIDCSHIAGNSVIENIVNPTCENYGSYEEVVYCQICSAELSRVKKIGDNPTGHLYVLDNYFDDVLVYRCSYCDDEYYESVFEIKYGYWNIEYCNKRVKTTWYDESSFCDLVPDGIINAKDYARITQICNENS